MMHLLTVWLVSFICRTCFSLKAYGTENVPKKGACLIASNHVSFLDPVVIASSAKRPLYYLGRESLFKGRVWGAYLRSIHVIPLDTSGMRKEGVKKALKLLKNGEGLVMFPEGTRSPDGGFLDPQPGIGFFAVKYGMPVVPVYVKDTAKALPRNAKFINCVPVRVFYGEPRTYELRSADKVAEYERVAGEIMAEIKKLKEKALAPDMAAA